MQEQLIGELSAEDRQSWALAEAQYLLRLLAEQAPVEPSSWGVLPIAALLAILTPWLFSLVDDRV